MKPRYEDLTGCRFGRLVAVKYAGNDENRRAKWIVRCDCGVEFETWAANLKFGRTRSCGCLKRDEMKGNERHKKI